MYLRMHTQRHLLPVGRPRNWLGTILYQVTVTIVGLGCGRDLPIGLSFVDHFIRPYLLPKISCSMEAKLAFDICRPRGPSGLSEACDSNPVLQ